MATAAPEAAPAAAGGKKKLILIIAIVLLVVVIGGVAAVLLLKKKAPVEGEDGEEETTAQVEHKAAKPGTPPVFLPVDPFTVNLADKEVDRYAQVGITLEVIDQKTADQLKNYMPTIRSGVLMVLSHKTAAELLTREGKEKLQREILAEAVRPLGFELEPEEAPADEQAPKKRKKKSKNADLPVTQVLFAQFIVQ